MRRLITTVLLVPTLLGIYGCGKAAKAQELPYYFPPKVIQTQNPSLQRKEYLRYLLAQWDCYQGNPNKISSTIPGNDSYRITFDGKDGRERIVSTDSYAEGTQYLTIILENFVATDNPDEFRVTTMCNQHVVTKHQMDFLVQWLKNAQLKAAELDLEHYKDLEKRAVKKRAEELDRSEADFRKDLDDRVEGTDENITYRELNQIPRVPCLSDFVLNELHFGPSPRISGILGLAYLNSGKVWYNPEAIVRDYLVGEPQVLMHEVIHANTQLQSWPMGGFDKELEASLPEVLLSKNKIDFFFHSYAADLRELAYVHFGFNFDQAFDEIFRINFSGAWEVDEEKWNKYFEELEGIKPVLLKVIEEDILPDFYARPFWWMAMNNLLNDDNAAFNIVMAQKFDMTILGGHGPTMLWLKQNEQTISDISMRVIQGLKHPKGNDSMGDMHVAQMWIDLYRYNIPESKRKEIEDYFKSHPDELKGLMKDHSKVFEYLQMFNVAPTPKGGVQ